MNAKHLRWLPPDDLLLSGYYHDGYSLSAIAAKLGRTQAAINSRVLTLKLKRQKSWCYHLKYTDKDGYSIIQRGRSTNLKVIDRKGRLLFGAICERRLDDRELAEALEHLLEPLRKETGA